MPTYTVKAGDNPAKIAQMFYGDQRYVQYLMQANGGALMLHPGDRLNIPSKPSGGGSPVVTNQFAAQANTVNAAISAQTGRTPRPMMSTTDQFTMLGGRNVNPSIQQASYYDFVSNKGIIDYATLTGGVSPSVPSTPTPTPGQIKFGQGIAPTMEQALAGRPVQTSPADRVQKENPTTQAVGALGGGYGAYTIPAGTKTAEARQQEGFTSRDSAALSPKIHPGIAIKNSMNVAMEKLFNRSGKAKPVTSGPQVPAPIDSSGNALQRLQGGAQASSIMPKKPVGEIEKSMTADQIANRRVQESYLLEQERVYPVFSQAQALEGTDYQVKLPDMVTDHTAQQVINDGTNKAEADAWMIKHGYVHDPESGIWKQTGVNGGLDTGAEGMYSPTWYQAVLNNIPTVPQMYERTSGGSSQTGYNARITVAENLFSFRGATG